MSLSAAHKAETRRSIIESARRLFKERGYNGVGIDAIMADAGLTHGGFYAHFDSKQDLFAEAISENGLEEMLEILRNEGVHDPAEQFRRVIEMYLSAWHKDHPGEGCPLPTLTASISQSDDFVRETFTKTLQEGAQGFASLMPGGSKKNSRKAFAVMATMVGGVLLARAVHDETLAQDILDICQEAIDRIADEQ